MNYLPGTNLRWCCTTSPASRHELSNFWFALHPRPKPTLISIGEWPFLIDPNFNTIRLDCDIASFVDSLTTHNICNRTSHLIVIMGKKWLGYKENAEFVYMKINQLIDFCNFCHVNIKVVVIASRLYDNMLFNYKNFMEMAMKAENKRIVPLTTLNDVWSLPSFADFHERKIVKELVEVFEEIKKEWDLPSSYFTPNPSNITNASSMELVKQINDDENVKTETFTINYKLSNEFLISALQSDSFHHQMKQGLPTLILVGKWPKVQHHCFNVISCTYPKAPEFLVTLRKVQIQNFTNHLIIVPNKEWVLNDTRNHVVDQICRYINRKQCADFKVNVLEIPCSSKDKLTTNDMDDKLRAFNSDVISRGNGIYMDTTQYLPYCRESTELVNQEYSEKLLVELFGHVIWNVLSTQPQTSLLNISQTDSEASTKTPIDLNEVTHEEIKALLRRNLSKKEVQAAEMPQVQPEVTVVSKVQVEITYEDIFARLNKNNILGKKKVKKVNEVKNTGTAGIEEEKRGSEDKDNSVGYKVNHKPFRMSAQNGKVPGGNGMILLGTGELQNTSAIPSGGDYDLLPITETAKFHFQFEKVTTISFPPVSVEVVPEVKAKVPTEAELKHFEVSKEVKVKNDDKTEVTKPQDDTSEIPTFQTQQLHCHDDYVPIEMNPYNCNSTLVHDVIESMNPKQEWLLVSFGFLPTFQFGDKCFHRVLNFKLFSQALSFCSAILDGAPFRPAEHIAVQLKPEWICNYPMELIIDELVDFIKEYDHPLFMKFYILGFPVKPIVHEVKMLQKLLEFNKIMSEKSKTEGSLRFIDLTEFIPTFVGYGEMYRQHGKTSGHVNDDFNGFLVQQAMKVAGDRFKFIEDKHIDKMKHHELFYDYSYLLKSLKEKEEELGPEFTELLQELQDYEILDELSPYEEMLQNYWNSNPPVSNVKEEYRLEAEYFYKTHSKDYVQNREEYLNPVGWPLLPYLNFTISNFQYY